MDFCTYHKTNQNSAIQFTNSLLNISYVKWFITNGLCMFCFVVVIS
jgi:hypothetical protein